MILWYLARAAGITAYACLSLATGLGALTARRPAGRERGQGVTGTSDARTGRRSELDVERRVVWQYAHRAAALVGVSLIGLHIVTLLADPYAHVGWRGLLPFGSGYRPLAVTFGVLALYLLVAVTLTGALRGRMARSAVGARRWRYLHASAYVAWGASAWHFLQAGSDSSTWWARAVLVGGVVIVAAGAVARVPRRTGIAPVAATADGLVRGRQLSRSTAGASR